MRLLRMTEEQIKALLKIVVDNSNRPFTNYEKEMLKQGIDRAHNLEELFTVAFASLFMGNR